MTSFTKVNDLSNSDLRKKYFAKEFVATSNLAAAMGRVSIKKNKDKGKSDEAQLEHIDIYARRTELEIVPEAVWDVAETASKHDQRKKFFELDRYLREHSNVKHVIFSHQSRSNRNRKSARMIEDWILDLGVVVHFARENRKLTCKSDFTDWLMWDVLNAKNAGEVADLKKNVMDGTIKRIERGLPPSKMPYGLKNHRPKENAESIVVFATEGQKEYMEAAFQLCSIGRYSFRALEKELATRFPQVPRKPTWTDLARLLRNPKYYGDFMYAGELHKGTPDEIAYPKLVSYSLWKKCQDVLDRPDRSKNKITERDHPYMGLIRCAGHVLDRQGQETDTICGWSITGEEKRKTLADGTKVKYYYWHCSNRKKPCSQRDKDHIARAGRERIYYRESEIEQMLWQVFAPLRFDEETVKWMQEHLLAHHKEQAEAHNKEAASLQARLVMLDRYIQRAYEDKLAGDIGEELWREKNSAWMLEKEAILRKLGSLNNRQADYIERGVQLIELLQHAEKIYKFATPDVKRQLAEFVGSNYTLRDGILRFDYRKPFDILAETDTREDWWTKAHEYRTFFLQNPDYDISHFGNLLAA